VYLNSALVVDEIRESEDGRVDLIGLREELYFDALPVLLERLCLFLDFAVTRDDRGRRHELEIRVLDPDEELVQSAPIRFRLPPDYSRPTAPLDPTLFEVPFKRFGLHAVEIRIGDAIVRRLPLFILPRDSGEPSVTG